MIERAETIKELNEDSGQVSELLSRQIEDNEWLDNAIRYSSGSEIDVSLKTRGHTALLSVSNDGEPIPPEKQEHLFDRFYRVDEARDSEGQHYGLGLAIARAAAEKHGGSIGVSCRDGKVTFTVSLQTQKA